MAGRKKSKPKGFDPEVWSLLSDDVKGRKDLSKAQKCVYALIVCMSDSYTVDGGWFWRRLDDFISELEECGMSLSKRELRRILSSLKEIGLIGYIPGHVENGKHVASSFQVVKNQVFNVKNVPLESCNVIEVSGNQPVMEKLSPLKEVNLREKEKEKKDNYYPTTPFPNAHAHAKDGNTGYEVGDEGFFSSSSDEECPQPQRGQGDDVVYTFNDIIDFAKADAIEFRNGLIMLSEYTDRTDMLLQWLYCKDYDQNSVLHIYDTVISMVPMTREQAEWYTYRGKKFIERWRLLVRRVSDGMYEDKPQSLWCELSEALKIVSNLDFIDPSNGRLVKYFDGSEWTKYNWWVSLCCQGLGEEEGRKLSAKINTPDKWGGRNDKKRA